MKQSRKPIVAALPVDGGGCPRSIARRTLGALFVVAALAAVAVVSAPAAAEEAEAGPVDARFFAPGMGRVTIRDPEGLWHATGLEIDLHDPHVRVESAAARPSVLGRETVSQIVFRRGQAKRWIAGAVGCDYAEEEGLPRGLFIKDGGLRSLPGGGPSFVLTRSGIPFIGSLNWKMEYETIGGTRIPIDRLNRRPGPGETALFTPDYGIHTRTADGVTEVELELYDAYLNPTGETRVRIGRVYEGIGNRAIPRLGFILTLPPEVYDRIGPELAVQAPGRIICRLSAGDVPDEARAELEAPSDGPAWPSRIALAVSGGARILRRGRISLEKPSGPHLPDATGSAAVQAALGLNPEWGMLWLVVVKPSAAPRVGIHDAARCLVLLGATEGMALAGGDLSPLLIRDRVINPPVSTELEVPLVDALIVYSNTLEPGLATLEVTPGGEVLLPPRGEIEFEVRAFDDAGQELAIPEGSIVAEHDDKSGDLEGFHYTAGGREGDTTVTFRVTGEFGDHFADTRAVVKISMRKPERLVVDPSPVIINPGERVNLTAELQDRKGLALRFPAGKVEWSLRGVEGTVSPEGGLIVTGSGRGQVEARFRKWRGTVPVYVGLLRVVGLDAMQAVDEWKPRYDYQVGAARSELRPLQGTIHGSGAGVLSYRYADQEMTQRATVGRELPVGGEPYGFRLRVYGDGSGLRLACLVRDRNKNVFLVPFHGKISWVGTWRELDAPLQLAHPVIGGPDARPRFPITFEGLALIRDTENETLEGRIGLGALSLLYLGGR